MNAAPSVPAAAGLHPALLSFQAQANANARVASLLKGWSPVFHLDCTDTGRAYSLRVGNCRLESVGEGHEDSAHVIRLSASEADLRALFTGGLNPVEAHSNGLLEVYGDPKDHVKLDAITMVLWNV
jgi:hypothetical protein